MPKYQLVASYYDMFEKDPTKKYKYQEIIDQEKLGIDLSTLQAIDRFTSNYTKDELLQYLYKKLNITGKNQLSIIFQKNKQTEPINFSIIEKNPEFTSCIKIGNLDKNTDFVDYYAFNQRRVTIKVNTSSELFKQELETLKYLLEQSTYEELYNRYPYPTSWLLRLAYQYYYGAHDNIEQEKEYWKNLVIKEFSSYKTFRGWILNKTKIRTNIRPEILINNPTPKPTPRRTEEVLTAEEYSKQYEQEFNEDKKNKAARITYQSKKTYEYNTSHLDDDKEEFLTEEEHKNLYEEISYSFPPRKTPSKSRKKPLIHSRSHEYE